MICGIDEAGRGAVLGPLVIAGVGFNENNLSKLEKLGVCDSKLLTPKQRELLFDKILGLCSNHHIVMIECEQIDSRFANSKNLNTLEIEGFKEILKRLNPKRAYVDSVLRNAAKLKQELSKVSNAELVVEHKADASYTVVGAASIIAKVLRDRKVKEIEKRLSIEVGSGYPSDPKTVRFLESQATNSPTPFVRQTWSSYKKIVAKRQQTKLSRF
ncbi:ribonuclease HII [Candidatus Woesearchaeota archaeon]|nr:ribonuclease HII [Candidatus Woesearchaeota archaeon]RLE43424.1 MAG: ribonuclease HII [Candidatus Woesearchaeota archaeon]